MTPLEIAKQLESEKLANDSINFFVPNNKYDTFIDEELPTPSYLVPFRDGYYIGWLLDGYTHTFKGIEFKNDTLKKISLVLNAEIRKKPPTKNIKNSYYTGAIHKLYSINENLRDLRTATRGLNTLHSGDDVAFNIIRSEAYKMKREKSLDYEILLEFSLRIIAELNISKKSFGDIQSKVKNIFKWTRDFYNAGTKKRVSIMNREDAAENARVKKTDIIRNKVFDYLKGLLSLNIDILKLSISFISRALCISWKSAKKYLVLFGLINNSSSFFKEHIPLIEQLEVRSKLEMQKYIKNTLWLTLKEVYQMKDKEIFVNKIENNIKRQ